MTGHGPDTVGTQALRGLLWTAVTGRDEYRAADVVFAALEDGLSAEAILLDVIAPVQARVGTEWAANRMSVAQEHAASAITERIIAALAHLHNSGHQQDEVVAPVRHEDRPGVEGDHHDGEEHGQDAGPPPQREQRGRGEGERVAELEVGAAVGQGQDAVPPCLVEKLSRQRGRPRGAGAPDLVTVRELAQQKGRPTDRHPLARSRPQFVRAADLGSCRDGFSARAPFGSSTARQLDSSTGVGTVAAVARGHGRGDGERLRRGQDDRRRGNVGIGRWHPARGRPAARPVASTGYDGW
ncbi:hypothetical protein EAO69_06380 [Streptomyces sp. me109]|uniref:cobalamin B12-binding domain-containing protein n=1 Tax=Streptomyces sp. me109 TaxID=1827853 RepID=UPI0011CE5B34|nr:B12-binding domain-containing protein [Streptomyces sp. me109]TXS79084.1 hypothetical protein EAO69_06380 [Streptomyces sp. me109]